MYVRPLKKLLRGDNAGDSSGGEAPTKTSESPVSPVNNIKPRINKVRPQENKTVEDPMISLQRKLLEQKKKERELDKQMARRGSEDEYLSDEFRPLPIRKKVLAKNPGSSPSPDSKNNYK